MNRQLRGKKWIESTTKYEDDNTLKITLVTLAKTYTKTMISATINYANDNIAEALKACRKMNIYKVIATLADNGKVWDGMYESNYVGKGFTLPCSGVIEKYELYHDGSKKLIRTINFESKVDGENKLTVTCEAMQYINDRDEKIITHTVVETKLPAYAYEEKKEGHEEKEEHEEMVEKKEQIALTTKIRKEVINYERAELKVKDEYRASQCFREINNIPMKSEFFIIIKTNESGAKEYLLNNLSLVIETIRNPQKMKINGFEAIRVIGRMDINGRETLDLIIKQDGYKIRTGGYGDYNSGELEHPMYLSYGQIAKEYTICSNNENVIPETSSVQAPAPATKKFTSHTGKKVKAELIDSWNNGNHQAAMLYNLGDNKELMIAIYTKMSTQVNADIILSNRIKDILKLIRHPHEICDTQIDKIVVRYYRQGKIKDELFKLDINAAEIEYEWKDGLKVKMSTDEAETKQSEYFFYNRKRVMKSAWELRTVYQKKNIDIPFGLCLRYAVSQERYYQGLYKTFEEATKEPSKQILDILHQKSEHVPTPEKRQERTIKYSIPYRLFKSSEKGGLYELISYFDGAIEETNRNYNKLTKEMEFTFKITSDSYKEARRFAYDKDTFDTVVSSTKILFLNHYKEELKKHGLELTTHLLTNDRETRKEYAQHKLDTGKITKETYDWFMSYHDGLLIPVLN